MIFVLIKIINIICVYLIFSSIENIKLINTFFYNVEVPKGNLIGELNAGWTIAKKLLQHERAFISNFGLAAGMGSKRDIVSIAKKHAL